MRDHAEDSRTALLAGCLWLVEGAGVIRAAGLDEDGKQEDGWFVADVGVIPGDVVRGGREGTVGEVVPDGGVSGGGGDEGGDVGVDVCLEGEGLGCVGLGG